MDKSYERIDRKLSMNEELRVKWQSKIETIIESYNMGCTELNKWEMEFLDSLERQLSEGKELTWKQSKKLNQIYEK